jgi:hypothetical protein
MQPKHYFFLLLFLCLNSLHSQTLLIPERVFDGMAMHEDWVVAVNENRITYAGPMDGLKTAGSYTKQELKGMTLITKPNGMIRF